MKTLLKKIEFDFTLLYEGEDNFQLELSENSLSSTNSVKMYASGTMIGRYHKVLTTYIIFSN